MPIVSNWISKYKVGVVESVEETGGKGAKKMKICKVNVGLKNGVLITVVTSAPNVRISSRLAVAPIGSTILGPTNEGVLVTKTSVAGVMSEGIFLDARMLAWDGGTVGIAAQVDESIAIGDPPPNFKPRPLNATDITELPESKIIGLFEKKLSKAEKKKISEEKKKARKAAKEAKKAAAEAGGGAADGEDASDVDADTSAEMEKIKIK